MDVAWYRWHHDDLSLLVQVQAGAKATGTAGLHGGRLKLKTRARATDGAANRAIIAFVAAQFGVPKSNVVIIRGSASRDKELLVRNPRSTPDWFAAVTDAPGGSGKVADGQGSL